MTLHLLCSPQFWQYAAIVAAVVGAIGWIRSGKSPFVWGMLLCLHAEAARQQGIESLGVAVRHFAAEYAPRVGRVRREFLEGA